MKTRSVVFFFALLFGMSFSFAQDGQYSIDTAASNMSILGTSTMHDWESVVEDYAVTATLSSQQLKDISMVAVVRSIKSGKGSMDNNTYNALKADEFPEIKFEATQLEIEGTSVKGTGELTIKAVTKEVEVDLGYVKNAEGQFQVTGEIPVTMTEFGVIPPTAMLGAVKTGDDVTIKFDVLMKQ